MENFFSVLGFLLTFYLLYTSFVFVTERLKLSKALYENTYRMDQEPISYKFQEYQEYQETSQESGSLFEDEIYEPVKPNKSPNPIVHMNLKNKFYIQNITDTQLFCIDQLPKTIEKIWSSASVKIRSTKPCVVSDGASLSDLVNRNDISTTLLRYINRFQVNANEERCDKEIFVTYYKNHFVHVESFDGELEVEYVFTLIDLRLISLCIVGALLFYASEKLARNEAFYYASGISIGIISSILILLFIVAKFVPKRTFGAITFLTGTSAFMFVSRWMYFNFQELGDSFKLYLFAYFAFSCIISTIFVYSNGPITNPRYINVIEWLLKFASISFIYMGVTNKNIFISFIIGFCVVSFSSKLTTILMNLKIVKKLSYKWFPAKRKLLSKDEYNEEADEFTRKQLKELQNYCRSPECNSWRIISRLKSPDKFARFVQNEENHVSEDEVSSHERYNISNDLIDADDDEEDISYNDSVNYSVNDRYAFHTSRAV